jgi:diguanylate cyclase (GGDEF)-like protein
MASRRSPELLRARYRILFFLILTLMCCAAGGRASLAIASAGFVLALISWRVAVAQGPSLSMTFATLDWLVVGLTLALAGGTRSWLLFSLPLLTLAELIPSTRHERPFVVAPALAMLAVLLIADPALGSTRFLGVMKVAGLVFGGALPAVAAGQPRRRRQDVKRHVPAVDRTTGFSTLSRVADLLGPLLAEAAEEHEPLSVICVRLDAFPQTLTFLGPQRAEAVVAAVARRAQRRLRSGDLAFRVSQDTFLLALRGRLPGQARSEAAGLRHDVSSTVVEQQRQTVSTGVASYPAARTLESLLREAQRDLLQTDAELRPAASL